MSKKKTLIGGLCSIAAVATLLVGCSSPEENVTEACDASKAYATSLETFQSTLNKESTIGEIRSAYDDVQSAYKTYAEATADVSKDRLEDLNSKQDSFDKAVKDLPEDATVSQSVDSLKDDAKAVESARADLASELKC
ncbi:hypothetical protein [Glutamicibacter sp.]|uniref:hypothetical protein n=1 Tax=Glutamicibacter sp. TaxID=1931995 RepID=UPI0028BD8F0B|nr:hypothetical protein [Glutamicibacter sp.]